MTQTGDLVRDHHIGITLSMQTPHTLPVHLFIPSWSKQAGIFINGKQVGTGEGGSFFTLNRQWNDSDRIEIRFGFSFRIEHMPDDEQTIAIFYGPMLLAFQSPDEIWLKSSSSDIVSGLKVTDVQNLIFSLNDYGTTYQLRPLFAITDESYSVYVRTDRLSD